MSSAVLVRANSASTFALSRRSRSSSTCSGLRLPARGWAGRPAKAPASPARRPPRQGAGVTGAAPLHQVRGVQPLPTQQRTPLTGLRGLVLGQELQLVLGGER